MTGLRAAICLFLLAVLLSGCGTAPSDIEQPEKLFNAANEAMTRGDNAEAIELYYRIVEKHPDFREYRPDALYRLGALLFRAERFEESEKILHLLANRHKNYARIKDAYEKLLYIYTRETKDSLKAKKIREIYEKRYGRSGATRIADRTEKILNKPLSGSFGKMGLRINEVAVIKAEKSGAYDPEFFPVACMTSKICVSPDMKVTAGRKKTDDGYYIFISENGKKEKPAPGTRNGFGQQWSWDNGRLFFTAMNWKKKERHIKVLDLKSGKTRDLFGAKNVGHLLCPSPDGSFTAFWYAGNIWLADSGGTGVTLISRSVPEDGIFMMAWAREGDRLLAGRKEAGRDVFYTLTLGHKEFVIVK